MQAEQVYANTIFEGLTPAEVAQVLPCIALAVKEYGPHECVLDKGDAVENPGVVLDGKLDLCEDSGGKLTVVDSIGKNGLFGQEAAFSSSGALPHRLVAHSTTRVLYLSGAFFLSPCAKSCDNKAVHQTIVKNMLRLLSDRTIALGKKIAYLTADDLKTKIAMYLCELCELNGSDTFNMPLNRDRLAKFFAVARPSLSRELIHLKNLGVIDFYRSSVKILDIDALYRLANSN